MINTPPLGPIQAKRYNRRGGYGIDYNLVAWQSLSDRQRNDIWETRWDIRYDTPIR